MWGYMQISARMSSATCVILEVKKKNILCASTFMGKKQCKVQKSMWQWYDGKSYTLGMGVCGHMCFFTSAVFTQLHKDYKSTHNSRVTRLSCRNYEVN